LDARQAGFWFSDRRSCARQRAQGQKAGRYAGRVAVRTTGNFNIQTSRGVVQGISHRHCRLVQRNDGYGYSINTQDSFDKGEAGGGRAMRDALSLPGMNAEVSGANG
jgi:hypothetical protein